MLKTRHMLNIIQKLKPQSDSAWFLVLSNMIPLFGVIFWQWEIYSIMMLYWAETGVIGFYQLLKILFSGHNMRFALIPFFMFHFGMFMLVHLIFIQFMFGSKFIGQVLLGQPILTTGFFRVLAGVLVSLIVFIISHGHSFYQNFYKWRFQITGRDVASLMIEPYKRVIIMHLTILVGGFLAFAFKAGVIGVIILVIVKTTIDLISHYNQHSKIFNMQPSVVSDL